MGLYILICVPNEKNLSESKLIVMVLKYLYSSFWINVFFTLFDVIWAIYLFYGNSVIFYVNI